MFIEESGRDQRHRREINRARVRGETEGKEGAEHDEVEPLREPQDSRDPEPDDQRAQPFPPIEIHILRRVNQVETRHPADDPGTQDQGRQVEPAGLRDPGARRRDREREPEKKMARAR